MSSKNESSGCEDCKRIPFRWSAVDKHVPEQIGIYGFWFRGYCIYIGKTEKQSLKKRLSDHWNGSHNETLNLWIAAKRDELKISFIEIKNQNEMSVYERYFIRHYQPLTNKIRHD